MTLKIRMKASSECINTLHPTNALQQKLKHFGTWEFIVSSKCMILVAIYFLVTDGKKKKQFFSGHFFSQCWFLISFLSYFTQEMHENFRRVLFLDNNKRLIVWYWNTVVFSVMSDLRKHSVKYHSCDFTLQAQTSSWHYLKW